MVRLDALSAFRKRATNSSRSTNCRTRAAAANCRSAAGRSPREGRLGFGMTTLPLLRQCYLRPPACQGHDGITGTADERSVAQPQHGWTQISNQAGRSQNCGHERNHPQVHGSDRAEHEPLMSKVNSDVRIAGPLDHGTTWPHSLPPSLASASASSLGLPVPPACSGLPSPLSLPLPMTSTPATLEFSRSL